MDSTREHLESRQTDIAGVGRDLHRLQSNCAATTEELREFLAGLKGRSPQEVMGVVAQSSLIGSTVLALVLSVGLILLLTAIPYALRGTGNSEEAAAVATPSQPAGDDAKTETQPGAATAGTPAADDVPTADATSASGKPDAARAAEAMGIKEAADPLATPKELDGKLDKLLDGL